MEIKKLEDINLADNVVKMDDESELDEAISQAVDQKVEDLDSVIEQKAGDAVQAILSSAAFKDAIDGILRQHGLIPAQENLENPENPEDPENSENPDDSENSDDPENSENSDDLENPEEN